MSLQGKAREGEESPDATVREKCAKVRSHLTPLRGKAREGEESPDAQVPRDRGSSLAHGASQSRDTRPTGLFHSPQLSL